MDKLADQARIMGEARMLRDEQPLTDELQANVFDNFRALLKKLDKSEQWAARSMAIGASTLSQVLSGKYAADPEPIVRKIDKWIELQVAREQAPKPGGFVKTRVAAMIYGVASLILKRSMMGLVTGPAGVGKTITLQAIHADTPGSLYMRITTAGTSKLAVLNNIARAMHLPGIKYGADSLEAYLVEKLRGTNRLLIFDEAHKLVGRRKDEALHTIRDLHDETKCPVLLAGMSNLATYVERGKADYEPLEQLDSRIGFRLNLTAIAKREDGGDGTYSVDDMVKWLSARKLKFTQDAVRYLQMIANTPGMGCLRTCEYLVDVAAAVSKGRPIDAEQIREIFAEQRGVRFVEAFERDVEIRAAAVG